MHIFRIPLFTVALLGGMLGAGNAQSTWRTDSLMTTWPVQQRMREIGSSLGRGVVRTVETEHLYTDLQGEAQGIPVFADSNVVLYTDLYGGPLREHFRVLLGAGAVYMPMIEQELVANELPAPLKYLPMALSGMNVQAGSSRGEAGLWMLTYPVALRYGLSVSALVDERHDDVKSTMAAVRYLKDLHARYTDWGVTIMAFACGPANVTRAQQRAGGSTDYRTLYPHFTDGQREVLPLLMAFIHLAAQAEELGLDPIVIMPWEMADTVRVEEPTSMATIGSILGTSMGRLKAMNPMLTTGLAPAGYPLRLPVGQGVQYMQLADSLQHMLATLAEVVQVEVAAAKPKPVMVEVEKTIKYRVRSGDSLGRIAEKHRVTIRQLKTWNKLKSDRINAGQMLLIHVKKREPVSPSVEPEQQLPDGEGATNGTQNTSIVQRTSPPERDTEQRGASYTVQSGDSLYRIAQRYPGVTAQLIMEANGIGTTIKPGQTLTIPSP